MDVESVLIKSNPDSLFEYDPFDDQSSYVCIVEYLDSPIEQQVSDPDDFDISSIIFMSCPHIFGHKSVDLSQYLGGEKMH